MIDFEFHSPSSLEEGFELMDRYGDDARVMAGGTGLVLQMKQRLSQPGHVIGLKKIPGLNAIGQDFNAGLGSVEVGALVTHRTLENDPVAIQKLPMVVATYKHVATPRIRSMATVGGGLVHGDPNEDPPPTLIALRASVVLTSSSGRRELPVEELFVDYYETDVQAGEILTSVIIPQQPPGSGSAYLKFLPRTADDYGTVAVAAVVTKSDGNICSDVKIVLGSVGMTPIHAIEAESALKGQTLTPENIAACASLVKDAVDPLDDFRGSAEYKRDMAEVFTRRAIQQAIEQIPANGPAA
jgi:carbon-monoxide dehydrogenase medium subunit